MKRCLVHVKIFYSVLLSIILTYSFYKMNGYNKNCNKKFLQRHDKS